MKCVNATAQCIMKILLKKGLAETALVDQKNHPLSLVAFQQISRGIGLVAD